MCVTDRFVAHIRSLSLVDVFCGSTPSVTNLSRLKIMRARILSTVALLFCSVCYADDPPGEATLNAEQIVKSQQEQLSAAEAVLESQFREAVAKLEVKYREALGELRGNTIKALESKMQEATRGALLDEAIALRDAIRKIQAEETEPPGKKKANRPNVVPVPIAIDLIDQCRSAAGRSRFWQVAGNALVANNLSDEGWLIAPVTPPREYDLLVTLKKRKANGANDTHIVIPFDGRAVTLAVRHAERGHGLGFFAAGSDNKVYDPPYGVRMTNDKFVSEKSTILFRVRPPSLRVLVDGQQLLDLNAPKLISKEAGVFKLGSWHNETIFSEFLLAPPGTF